MTFSVVPQSYDQNQVLPHGGVTNNYADHLPRSSAPGMDVALPNHVTDVIALHADRPTVRSPVDGIVTLVAANRWGTVRVRDKSGFEHTMLHNYVGIPLAYFVKEGTDVRRGQPIAYIGNVVPPGRAPVFDHVHYYITRSGRFYDPESLSYSPYDGSVVIPEQPRSWMDRSREEKHREVELSPDHRFDAIERLLDRLDDILEKLDKLSDHEAGAGR